MKKYDNINYSLFLKLICIVSILALVFAVAVVMIGVFFSTDSTESETYETHIKLPEETDDPNTEELPRDTELTPPKTDEPTDTAAPDTEENVPDIPSPTVLAESEDMGQEYLDKIVFVVDATNVGLRSYGVLSGGKDTTQVWRSTSGTVTLTDICSKKIVYPQSGAEMTIADAAAKAKPEYMVIALGFEGINNISAEDFMTQYTALINAVKAASPETKIMLQSIYPIAARVKAKVTNSIIDETNNNVMSVAQSNDVKYLDTCVILKDESGALREVYDNGGTGWNLNKEGFEAVLSYIRTHGYK